MYKARLQCSFHSLHSYGRITVYHCISSSLHSCSRLLSRFLLVMLVCRVLASNLDTKWQRNPNTARPSCFCFASPGNVLNRLVTVRDPPPKKKIYIYIYIILHPATLSKTQTNKCSPIVSTSSADYSPRPESGHIQAI